jgi:hypothetical protein
MYTYGDLTISYEYHILPQLPAFVLDGLNLTMLILERGKNRLLKGNRMFQLKKCITS